MISEYARAKSESTSTGVDFVSLSEKMPPDWSVVSIESLLVNSSVRYFHEINTSLVFQKNISSGVLLFMNLPF